QAVRLQWDGCRTGNRKQLSERQLRQPGIRLCPEWHGTCKTTQAYDDASDQRIRDSRHNELRDQRGREFRSDPNRPLGILAALKQWEVYHDEHPEKADVGHGRGGHDDAWTNQRERQRGKGRSQRLVWQSRVWQRWMVWGWVSPRHPWRRLACRLSRLQP